MRTFSLVFLVLLAGAADVSYSRKLTGSGAGSAVFCPTKIAEFCAYANHNKLYADPCDPSYSRYIYCSLDYVLTCNLAGRPFFDEAAQVDASRVINPPPTPSPPSAVHVMARSLSSGTHHAECCSWRDA